ncbi:uncharacterized protein LOC116298964 [Actinia tenebrosa]|uniref:Uncharacterized protein LOC116298964 n=1 Tax=Actinia tenebrosa TaxID=6105 RepID=A0A6P8I831_ACTTE|nr:uncharacterized protein LOC116298964 [Actinia tenebrosa]
MVWSNLFVTLGLLCIYCLQNTEQCSPPKGWRPMQPHERAEKAEIVAFGTVVESPQSEPDAVVEGRFYTVLLKVHCIVRGPKLPQYINVSGFSDFSGGLCVHSKAFLNKSYVVFLELDHDNPGEFRVLEVNIQKGAVHVGHKFAVLREVMLLFGQNASLPIGADKNVKPGCPDFANNRGIFRDPEPNKRKQSKACRCRKKKQKRKKKKRFRGNLMKSKAKLEDVTSKPTVPRTRRYNVLNLEQDKVEKEHQVPHSVKTLSFSNTASHQSLARWCLFLLTFHSLVVFMLLPT